MPRQSRFRPCRLAGAASLAFWVVVVSAPAVIPSAEEVSGPVAATTLSGQIFGEPPRSPRRPQSRRIFNFELSYGVVPLDELRTWVMAAEHHRPEEMDDAARTIAAWRKTHLENVVEAFEHHVREKMGQPIWTPAASDESAAIVLRRAVILHTDIGVLALHDRADSTALLPETSLHFGAAMELIDFLRREIRGDPFPRLWYRAAVAFLQSQYEVAATPAFADRAVSLFPDDGELLLMAGCAREMTASPRVQDAVDLIEPLQGVYGKEAENLQRAALYYRRSLKSAPDSVEARIRLGHVLGERSQHQEALEQLKGTPDAAPDPELRYFASLFLGDAYAALDDSGAARGAYQQAHDLFRRARSIHLALSRLARQDGDLEGAVAAVREALSPSSGADPWNGYYMAGPARHANLMLADLRAAVRPPVLEMKQP